MLTFDAGPYSQWPEVSARQWELRLRTEEHRNAKDRVDALEAQQRLHEDEDEKLQRLGKPIHDHDPKNYWTSAYKGSAVRYKLPVDPDDLAKARANLDATTDALKTAEKAVRAAVKKYDGQPYPVVEKAKEAGTRFVVAVRTATFGNRRYWRGEPISVETIMDLPTERRRVLMRARVIEELPI